MKAHIDCPCSLQPRPLSPQRASTQASWWVGIPCAVAKIDRHVCVCACVCVCALCFACWRECWHPLCHGPRHSHIHPIERAAPSDAGFPLSPAARHDITSGSASPQPPPYTSQTAKITMAPCDYTHTHTHTHNRSLTAALLMASILFGSGELM